MTRPCSLCGLVAALVAAMLVATPTSPVSSMDVFYDFEGDSGDTVTDKLTDDGAQDGAISNEVSFTSPAPFGDQAGLFEPPIPEQLFSSIELRDSSELGSAFTLAANFSTTNTGFTRLFTSYGGTGAVGDRVLVDMDPSGGVIPGIRAIINNTVCGTTSVPAALTTPGYHHVAVTYDDGDVQIYIDGSVLTLDNNTAGSGAVSMGQNMRFGEDPHDLGGAANEQFRGNVDELLVIGRALSAGEVAAIASSGVVVTPGDGLAIYYDFEAPDSGTTITDRFTGDGAQDGIAHNNVAIDTDSANAAQGVQSAVLGDKPVEQLFSTIEISGSTDLGGAFTIAADFNTTNTGFTRLFTSFRGTGPVANDRMLVDMDASGGVIPGIRAIINNTVVQTAAPPAGLADPGYHHVAVTFNSGDVVIYVDGSEVASGNVGPGPIVMTHNLQFGEDPHDGGGSADEQFRGNVDELLVLGRVLSAGEIASLASSGVAGNVVQGDDEFGIYYDFESPDSGTTITDRFLGDAAQDGIVHNNVAIDADSANASQGSQSAVLGDKPATIPHSVIDTGVSGNLGSEVTLAATINVPGGGFSAGGLTRLFSTFAGTGSPAGRLIFDFDPNASVEGIGIRLILPDGTAVVSNATFEVNQDHHLAMTYDNGDVTLYLDGAVAGTASTSGDVDLGDFALRIGEDLGGAVNENFVGIMDDVLILSRSLSAEEVQQVAEEGFASTLGGGQLAGDCNQDGMRDISDALCLFGFLFEGTRDELPCGDGSKEDPANLDLVDHNGDGMVDVSDGVALLNFLFVGGPPPVSGLDCFRIPGCESKCDV